MGEFLSAAFGFPAVLFTFLLVLVVGYWVLVLVGVLDADAEGTGVVEEFLSGFGFAGVPAAVVLSVLIAVGWFVSLAGTGLLNDLGVATLARFGIALVVLLVALVVGGFVARLLMRPLRPLFTNGEEASRHAFVGRLCVIRTGQVTADFGQAEVTAVDGSSAIIQVRHSGDVSLTTATALSSGGVPPASGAAVPGDVPVADGVALTSGSAALIYDYDVNGEFFRVVPVDAVLDPSPFPRR